MIEYNLLKKHTVIVHFCTTRKGGVSVGNFSLLNLSPFSGDNPAHFAENKRILCTQLGIQSEKLIIPYQNHGTEVKEIDEAFFGFSAAEKTAYLNGVDALVTKLPGVCIGVTTADCVPLLFFDPTKKVVAVAHAGWRGTCGRIAEKTVLKLQEKYKCNPADILVCIGPSISVQVYEVGKEVIENFEKAGFDIESIVYQQNEKFHLDLWRANEISLLQVGIKDENIEVAGICTFTEHERFFSARRLGIKSGRMLSGIMLR